MKLKPLTRKSTRTVTFKDDVAMRLLGISNSTTVSDLADRGAVSGAWSKCAYHYRNDIDSEVIIGPGTPRDAVNYARHNLTTYDQELSKYTDIYGNIRHASYRRIKREALDIIAERWPELTDECRNQADEIDFYR